jgi:hypothetical protein
MVNYLGRNVILMAECLYRNQDTYSVVRASDGVDVLVHLPIGEKFVE